MAQGPGGWDGMGWINVHDMHVGSAEAGEAIHPGEWDRG